SSTAMSWSLKLLLISSLLLFILWHFSVTVKPGICPPDNIRCIQPQPDKCAMDSNCQGKMKCCHARCAMRCVYPLQGM
uniref:WAP domain-containing protein n=1 Tax=Chelydra serpentina TaxID=8475 RepID=A0A8C3SLD3_CHESE